MRFKLTLEATEGNLVIPINYQYPLSSAIYRIIAKGDKEYASFLHERGYGKGYKFFSFSDIKCPFKIQDDRLVLKQNTLEFQIAFQLPEAMQHFVQGLFASEEICIADKKSKQSFKVKSIETIPNLFSSKNQNEILSIEVKPFSPLVVGEKNERRHYDYLKPEDLRFLDSFIMNWREKIKAFYDLETANTALLMVEPKFYLKGSRPRLITIKDNTEAETKIKGYINFKIAITAERRFIDLLLNVGGGLYNAQGMGFLEVIDEKKI